MKILDVKNLDVVYCSNKKEVLAVDNVSFSMNEGDSLGIVGESGSGKSTLAMAILRLLNPKTAKVTGNIDFMGHELLSLPVEELNKLRWKEISVVFQKSMNALSPIHKIGEQLEDIYRVHYEKATKEEIREVVMELFRLVNLSDRVYDLYPHELSGGMLQRTSIALGLLLKPSLIILDEATTALDVVTQGQILREICKLEEEIKMTRIMITHDIFVVASSCQKVAVMYAGRMMEMGQVQDVLLKPYHPYTQGLINAFPSLKGEKEDLKGIPGSLPNLAERYEGCIFAPRCSKAQDICKKTRPEYREIKDGHAVACHFAEEV